MSYIGAHRRIGQTELSVTALGLGCAPLGNMFTAVAPGAAEATIEAALVSGIRYFDTAPSYGFGLSESRLGLALQQIPRRDIVISSKVGYSLVPVDPSAVTSRLWADTPAMRTEFDFSRDAVLRSIDASLQRLGTSHIDMLAIHDPDEVVDVFGGADPRSRSHFKAAMEGAYPVLADLRSQGVIKAVGVGINQWQMLCDFAEAGDFDYFLLAGRYTLLDQEALSELFPLCEKRGVSLIIGAPYNSGILATGAVHGATFNYRPAAPEILDKVGRIEAVCARHGVALQAAALQFPLRHPLVASIIPGARSIAEMQTSVSLLAQPIPDVFWAELKAERLIDVNAPVAAELGEKL
ncbi:aldo/keto reductase [Variovorax sp. RB3P1]|uniref:aldo/keto reductase n=1 Tax=Variovorax sp. RB3P1 TaxID=3443732 RepID=UPI003F466629